jgi:hypothetical protein
MTSPASVLALGGHGSHAWALAERASRLGFQLVRAKTPEDAIALRAERGFQVGAALIDSEFPAPDLRDALQAIRTRLEASELEFIATGPHPDDETSLRLGEAGVELALWEPVGNHTLRFQLNRALARIHPNLMRGERRVPTEWRVNVFTGGRQKAADVYSISGGGAFLATPQPSMSGAQIAVELPLPTGRTTLDARVIYTNVPGNLKLPKLPHGMAIRFSAPEPAEMHAIAEVVSQTAASLAL